MLRALTCLILLAAPLTASEPIRFARTPDLSPDGRTVAFSYLGDIWTVDAIGGIARPVTLHEAHDYTPVFSPDGRSLAFASNRYGSYDVFVVPTVGGRPKRLTSDSATDIPVAWTPDGKEVLFTSGRTTTYPATNALYAVPATGGAVRQVVGDAKDGRPSPDGEKLAFTRGQGTWYRKGYRGSSNDDLWLSDRDGANARRVTEFTGQDVAPMWAPDGKTLYYISEDTGTLPANIVKIDTTAPGKPTPQLVTTHADDAVRRARIAANGRYIVYECGADLWVVGTDGRSPARKLAIEAEADDKVNAERVLNITSGATEYAPSPDEKHVAFVVQGEIFLTALPGGGKATRLTEDPAFDHGLSWSPDGKKIVFASDRAGHEDLYLLEADDPDTTEIVKAHRFRVKALTKTTEGESDATFSPDGKRIAFLKAGQLWTMAADGSDAKVAVSAVQVFDYTWSPDGKYFAYARSDGSYASEIYVVPVDGSEPARNVTRYATFNADVSWSRRGGKIAFVGQRRTGTSMHVLSLHRPAAAAALPSSDIDWDDIHLRTARIAVSAEAGAISPDGEKVAFRSTDNGGNDLWIASADGRSASRVTTNSQRPRDIRWSRTNSSQLFFLDRIGAIRIASASGGDPARVPFTAKLTFRRDEEFAEIFAQSWRLLNENFYDAGFHGTDWAAMRARYAPLVKHVALKEDLYALISLMLGELNSSHLGIAGPVAAPEEITADLGLLFDANHKGPGLKVAEVLKRGPADKRGLQIKVGDVITAIDRQPVDGRELSELLNGKVNEPVALEIASSGADPKAAKRRVEVQGIDRNRTGELLYDRWVTTNAKKVESLSGGKLGYIHIPSMNDEGLESFVRSLYSDNADKEGLVLDVRNNGGGFTHDRVLNYLAGREHTLFRQRNGGDGLVVRENDRKWTKPVVVLINERTYSDAEVFPSALRSLGLGKLVGQPTGGQVIFTYRVPLIDGSLFALPRTGVFTARGVNMEREAVQPDFVVAASPEQLARGDDPQIAKAVNVLGQDVIAWKKSRIGLFSKSDGAGTTATGSTPAGNR